MVDTAEGQACWEGAGGLPETLRRGQALYCKAPELQKVLLVLTVEGGTVLDHVRNWGWGEAGSW